MNGLSRQGDGSRSHANEESAQDNQDSEFRDELSLSDPAHPLFPTNLSSNSATYHSLWCCQNWQIGGRSRTSKHLMAHAL